jgi:hypothetical protein
VKSDLERLDPVRTDTIRTHKPKGGGRRTKIISKGFIKYIADKTFLESQAVVK